MAFINGTARGETLPGTAAADLILGRGGDDLLVGGTGNDVILGGAGRDTIWGENAFGLPPATPGNPYPLQTYGANLILAGAGRDLVRGGLGADTILGGEGDDTLYGAVSESLFTQSEAVFWNQNDRADLLLGGAGNDLIDAGSGNDTILGGRGDDTIRGTLGADLILGGPGADRFVYQRINTTLIDSPPGEGGRDVILDFHHGQDVIDLGAYRSPTFGPEPRPEAIFLGTGPFQASLALQVRYSIEGERTVVQFYSVLGPDFPTADLAGATGEIELAGRHHLQASDFILA